jgi:hypothetical protein
MKEARNTEWVKHLFRYRHQLRAASRGSGRGGLSGRTLPKSQIEAAEALIATR